MVQKSNSRKIGTMQEGSLHASLKTWYMIPGDLCEVGIDGYLVDIVRGELLIEIQTRNFAALRQKLTSLTENHPILLVYPISQEKWIVYLASDGCTPIGRRRSPKRGGLEQLFYELVSIPNLVRNPRFSLEILLIREEEYRCTSGQTRKGWITVDRHLIKVIDRVIFRSPTDYRSLLPAGLLNPFTSRDLASALRLSHNLAQKMTYCLRSMGTIEVVGKRGNSFIYASSPGSEA